MYPVKSTSFADGGEARNSALRYLVTVGKRVDAPNIIANRDISWVMECVRSGIVEETDIRALIHTIRSLPNEKLARAMKASLPYFLGSVCRPPRSNNTVEYANFAIFDLDHVPDIEAAKRHALEKLPFLRWAFRSVRDGVKLLAQFDRPVADQAKYRVLWNYLARQVERALELPVDSTPDWSRACFFSFDPGLLYSSSFRPVKVGEALAEAEQLLPLLRPRKEAQPLAAKGNVALAVPMDGRSPEEEFALARRVVEGLATRVIPYHDWIRAGMALYAGFGERGRELWHLFLSNPNYSDSEADLDRHWRSFSKIRNITLGTLFYLGGVYGCQA